MQVGKITSKRLQETVLSRITNHRDDVLVNSGLGEDSAVVDFGDEVLAISSDPITGAGKQAGYLAVQVACNDLAATGAEPIGIQVVLLLPPDIEDEEISQLMGEIDKTAADMDIQILGGHTEIISDVSRSLIVVTAIGRAERERFVATGGACEGDDLLLTKGVGLEGCFILASDFGDYLLEQGINQEIIDRAREYQHKISVLPEGLIAAEYGVNSLHDITEGGLYGALTEMSQAAGVGFLLEKSEEIVPGPVREITSRLGIDPCGLISSGSMLISLEDGEGLKQRLGEEGIDSYRIGKVTSSRRRVRENGRTYQLTWQGGDELWDFIKKMK